MTTITTTITTSTQRQRQRRRAAHVAAAAMGSTALTSLTALGTVLNAVDTASVVGRSGLPMLHVQKREGDGTWMFGQKKTIVEDDSRWAVNPASFKWGYICFNDDNKPAERLVPVSQPKPDVTELPDTGFEWHEQWAVNLKCISGADAGIEVIYKADDRRRHPGRRRTDRGDA